MMTRTLGWLAALGCVALLVGPSPASARRGEPVLVSQAGGAGANGPSFDASSSADGRYVAFDSHADNLSTGDDNSVTNVFVRDVQAGTTTLVSQAGGAGADRSSFNASISADGRYVAFTSQADNLSTGDEDLFTNEALAAGRRVEERRLRRSRLPIEEREKFSRRVDRELGSELEQVPIRGHECGVLACGERDQVVVSGIFGRSRRRLVGVLRDRCGAFHPSDDCGGLALVNSVAELRIGERSPELRQ
jgi:dipeptidyl aminopeptidase/acylaminoacyl peptidase